MPVGLPQSSAVGLARPSSPQLNNGAREASDGAHVGGEAASDSRIFSVLGRDRLRILQHWRFYDARTPTALPKGKPKQLPGVKSQIPNRKPAIPDPLATIFPK